MNPKLQAGVEVALEKTARSVSGKGLLSDAINSRLRKYADDQLVQQEHASSNTSPSSSSSAGMEDKNSGYGKSTNVLDDDPSKDQNAQETGSVTNAVSGRQITTEPSGMPDLAQKQASNRSKIKSMLQRLVPKR